MVREATDRLLSGETMYGVVSDWIKRGETTQRGGRWSSRGLKRALICPALAGLRSHRGHLLPARWGPILEHSRWEQLRLKLTDPRRKASGCRGSYTGAWKFALSGLLHCGLCGKPLVSNPYDGKPSFICSGRVYGGCGKVRTSYDEVEAFVVDMVMARLDAPAIRAALAEDRGRTDEIQAMQTQIREDEDQLRLLGNDYDDGLITRSEWLARRGRIQDRIEQTTRKLEGLLGGTGLVAVPSGDEVRHEWAARDVTWRRTLLSTVLAQVRIHPYPAGVCTRPSPDPEKRREIVRQRVEILWRA